MLRGNFGPLVQVLQPESHCLFFLVAACVQVLTFEICRGASNNFPGAFFRSIAVDE